MDYITDASRPATCGHPPQVDVLAREQHTNGRTQSSADLHSLFLPVSGTNADLMTSRTVLENPYIRMSAFDGQSEPPEGPKETIALGRRATHIASDQGSLMEPSTAQILMRKRRRVLAPPASSACVRCARLKARCEVDGRDREGQCACKRCKGAHVECVWRETRRGPRTRRKKLSSEKVIAATVAHGITAPTTSNLSVSRHFASFDARTPVAISPEGSENLEETAPEEIRRRSFGEAGGLSDLGAHYPPDYQPDNQSTLALGVLNTPVIVPSEHSWTFTQPESLQSSRPASDIMETTGGVQPLDKSSDLDAAIESGIARLERLGGSHAFSVLGKPRRVCDNGQYIAMV